MTTFSKMLEGNPHASKMFRDNLDNLANACIKKIEEGKNEQNDLVVQRQPHWNTSPASITSAPASMTSAPASMTSAPPATTTSTPVTDQGPFQPQQDQVQQPSRPSNLVCSGIPTLTNSTFSPMQTEMIWNTAPATDQGPFQPASMTSAPTSTTSAPATEPQGPFQSQQDQVHQPSRPSNLVYNGTNTFTNSNFSPSCTNPLITYTTPILASTISALPDSTTTALPASKASALPASMASALPASTTSAYYNHNPKKVFMSKYTNSVSPSASTDARTITVAAPPQSTFIPRRGDPTTLDLEIANALLQLHSSASAPPNIEAIKVKEEPITTFEESQNFLEEKAASINEEEDKENHQPMSYNNHTVSSQFISKKSAICLKNS